MNSLRSVIHHRQINTVCRTSLRSRAGGEGYGRISDKIKVYRLFANALTNAVGLEKKSKMPAVLFEHLTVKRRGFPLWKRRYLPTKGVLKRLTPRTGQCQVPGVSIFLIEKRRHSVVFQPEMRKHSN